jgi:hypothetical protein
MGLKRCLLTTPLVDIIAHDGDEEGEEDDDDDGEEDETKVVDVG